MTRFDENAPPPAYDASKEDLDGFKVALTSDSQSVLVTVTPPLEPIASDDKKKEGQRAPLDLCCVIDVSGSMDAHAPVPGENGTQEETGLSVLDIVRHALLTIIETMREDDRLSLVTFSGTAKIIAELTELNAAGKKRLTSAVEGLRPLDSTNLWDGLRTGMDVLNKPEAKIDTCRLSSIFLLTDGCPNVNPPRGHIPALERYLESNPQSSFTISTFGFGYSLDSRLLSDIAAVGGGGYGFIPDSGMVGTVFVHALSNLAATYATKCTLSVEIPDGWVLKDPKGKLPVVNADWGSTVHFGDLQYGQTRDILLEFGKVQTGSPLAQVATFLKISGNSSNNIVAAPAPQVTITVKARPWFDLEPREVAVSYDPASLPTPPPPATEYHLYHSYRFELVDKIFSLVAPSKGSSAPTTATMHGEFKNMAKEIQASLANYPAAVALAEDISGEIALAVDTTSSGNWTKWGQHYFPSIARSYQRQQCSNFKDPGLQVFGEHSPVFIKLRDEADATFDKIPPPKPSKQTYPRGGWGGYRGGAPAGAAPVRSAPKSMAVWNSRAGPCFTGDCTVKLANGEAKLEDLKRGMVVATPLGGKQVVAIMKTVIEAGELALCTIGDLKVTPWHPIYYQGKWCFPADVVEPQIQPCSAIYSLLLESDANSEAHSAEICGVRAVTLGHGLVSDPATADDVRNHPFFGSYGRMVKSLCAMPGFFEDDGVVQCSGVVRGHDGLISGFLHFNANDAKTDFESLVAVCV